MITMIRDPGKSRRFREDYVVTDGDKFDEVWEGTYNVMPQPTNVHQRIVGGFQIVIGTQIDMKGRGQTLPGANVSDRSPDWDKNYRCPDLAVVLLDSIAKDCGSYWLGGPDFLMEVVSPDDGAWEKIPFYSKIKVRELLIVDRDPWKLTLLRHDGDTLVAVGDSTVENGDWLKSEVLKLKFRLVAGESRPQIEIQSTESEQNWKV